jgi:hypothetical protein
VARREKKHQPILRICGAYLTVSYPFSPIPPLNTHEEKNQDYRVQKGAYLILEGTIYIAPLSSMNLHSYYSPYHRFPKDSSVYGFTMVYHWRKPGMVLKAGG